MTGQQEGAADDIGSAEDHFCDASVLVALAKARNVELLWLLWPGRIVVPTVVQDELQGRNFTLPIGQRMRKKHPKPFWQQAARLVGEAQAASLLQISELTPTEDTLAMTFASRMHPGEASVLAMAMLRAGVCCCNDLRAVRAKCEKEGVPLLGTCGILYTACCEGVLTAEGVDAAIRDMVASDEKLPVTGFEQIRAWFQDGVGLHLYDED